MYQPKTGASCSCKPGVQRDNCPHCEGTGHVVDSAIERGESEAIAETPTREFKNLSPDHTSYCSWDCGEHTNANGLDSQPQSVEHTPTPWEIITLQDAVPHLMGADHARVALLDDCHLDNEAQANAAFILRAVNAHDALVEAIRVAALRLSELNEPSSPLGAVRDDLYAAFKLAEGEETDV